MADDIAIKVSNVSKNFALPHQRPKSLKDAFINMFRSSMHKNLEVQHALRDISFDIKKGEFFGIVGRNGSGKSTMLKMIAGIYQPTKGSLIVNGKLVPFIELGVGFNPELTGRENVYLNGALLGFSHKEVAAMYDDIVAFSELEQFMDQKLKNYSSGMQVRLAFSVATRAEADILLVDEVLAVGDADFQRKCFEYFRELKKKKKTVIFVSHDMNAVREYCDKAVLIDGGKLIFAGSAENAAKKYTRLFMPKGDEQTENAKRGKWGSGDVDIVSIKANKKVIEQTDKYLEVKVTIKAAKDLSGGLIPGITVKNEADQPLFGTNSKILRLPNVELAKGEQATLVWKIPNIFNEGRITLEPAVVRGSNLEVCQWWDDALTVQVVNEQKTPYPIAPSIDLQVVKTKS